MLRWWELTRASTRDGTMRYCVRQRTLNYHVLKQHSVVGRQWKRMTTPTTTIQERCTINATLPFLDHLVPERKYCFECGHSKKVTFISVNCFQNTRISDRVLKCSAEHERLVVPKSRLSSAGDWAFSIYAPKTWNSIPIDIRWADTVDIFKKKLLKVFVWSTLWIAKPTMLSAFEQDFGKGAI